MVSVLTVAEFRKQIGTAEADAVLQEVIDQAEREINGWITLYELTAVTGDRFKAASSLLSKAGWIERLHFTGGLPGDGGAKYYSLDKKADQLRVAAKALIIVDVATAEGAVATPTAATHYVLKVNS
jgi:hypothetical protein